MYFMLSTLRNARIAGTAHAPVLCISGRTRAPCVFPPSIAIACIRLAHTHDSPHTQPMRFTPEFLDELRARLQVSEVVGRRVKLKKAGREFKGLSPFQQEKTPSFTVNDQKQFYHDFSTGKHGHIFDFVMETEGVNFVEAVERLASMAGMPLPAVTPDAARHEQRRKTLYDVMELAAKFFTGTLASRGGAKARGYLGDRAISPATQLQFRIGYAPNERFALKEHLGNAGIPVEDMVEAGLRFHRDDIPVPHDLVRGPRGLVLAAV